MGWTGPGHSPLEGMATSWKDNQGDTVRRAPHHFSGSCLDFAGCTGSSPEAQETGRINLLGWKSSEDSTDGEPSPPTLSASF